MDDTPATRSALATWLLPRLDRASTVEVVDFAAPRSGYSAETTVFDARVSRGATEAVERFVLRRETPEPAVYPTQVPGLDVEIAIQYRAMQAVASHSAVPVAPLIGYEADSGVLGAPFFVMGHVAGEVPIENPMYTAEGFFVEATPAQRERLVTNGLRVLAELHRIDWTAAGLEWLVPPGITPGITRQLDVWQRYAEAELAGREHPRLQGAFEWLRAHRPTDPAAAFSWGDPRPGNIIWQDFEVGCLTDFEACSIAPPEHDIGWWLMFDRSAHETIGAARLEGEPTRAEQVALYEGFLGRPVGDLYWHEVFAAARYAAIVVRVMNRMVQRGHLPADQTVWIENPAVTCLAELMGR